MTAPAMIDHLSLGVRDLALSQRFYDAALKPLGYSRHFDADGASGYGASQVDAIREHALSFWIAGEPEAAPMAGHHICFAAPDRAAVEAFYHAALAAGGRDNGPPGLRPHYHPTYYAAFVIDPDGHRIEAVCHTST